MPCAVHCARRGQPHTRQRVRAVDLPVDADPRLDRPRDRARRRRPCRTHRPRDTRTHDSALLLGGSAALAIVALPILRGYTFLGGGDSLSHVGWARDQRRNPPSGPVALSRDPHGDGGRGETAGISLLASNLYVVLLAFPLVFLLCVPLAVQLIGRTRGRTRPDSSRPRCSFPSTTSPSTSTHMPRAKGSSTRRSSSTSRCFTSTADR